MRIKVLRDITLLVLFCFPGMLAAQRPDLGAASWFALFTVTGAFTNTGTTSVTGDVGTNSGALTGSPNVNGQIHVADSVSALAAPDVDTAYFFLNALTCDSTIGTTLGSNQVLPPNVYCLGSVSTLGGDLILDGQGDSTSIFVFKIDAAFSTTTLSKVVLTGSAKPYNVFWKVNGALELGAGSAFIGTILVNGSISLLDSASLEGRALSRAGAVTLINNTVDLGTQPFNPLPVILISFEVKKSEANSAVILTWQTAMELNSDYFLVERSTDGTRFKVIGKLDAAGNSLKVVAYSFIDKEPAEGTNYYRLHQFDFNGMHEYSQVKVLYLSNTALYVSVYPNPFSTSITVYMHDATHANNYIIRLTDIFGKQVAQQMITGKLTHLETTGLPSGLYFYRITGHAGEAGFGRLVSR